MSTRPLVLTALALTSLLSACASSTSNSASTASGTVAASAQPSPTPTSGARTMQLGNFSVSLVVKDLAASRAFYEKLGFSVRGGNQAQNWLVMQNDSAVIGLFQGMFERNMLTFNPGWDRDKNTPASFDDVREIQRRLKAEGIPLTVQADEATTGPAYIMLTDPDGNPILIDQHVPAPKAK